MKFLFWLISFLVISMSCPARGVELQPLAACTVKVFREINRSRVWSGKAPAGCVAEIRVEKRPSGLFVTTWTRGSSERGWEQVSLSSAMAFREVADRKLLEKAGRDISTRTAHIERCLAAILRVNDPLDCRDYAARTYSAGQETGIEFKRSIWLDDNGRHSVVEYAYGDTNEAVSPPADLFNGPALPAGTNLNIHIFDTD